MEEGNPLKNDVKFQFVRIKTCKYVIFISNMLYQNYQYLLYNSCQYVMFYQLSWAYIEPLRSGKFQPTLPSPTPHSKVPFRCKTGAYAKPMRIVSIMVMLANVIWRILIVCNEPYVSCL